MTKGGTWKILRSHNTSPILPESTDNTSETATVNNSIALDFQLAH